VLGLLEPDRIYPITWFEQRLGVGRTPIREGLLDLISHGLVLPVRNRGYRVASLEDPDVEEIFRLRELLEVPAHSAAAGKIDGAGMRQLRDLLTELRRAAAQRDALGFVTADREFHLTIARYGGSRWVLGFISRLRDQVRIRGAMAAALMRMNSQHADIVTSLERGNSKRVAEIASRHLSETKRAWLLSNQVSRVVTAKAKRRRTGRGGATA
jgi:DNA-binding GntR family transcriptional regulator